MATLPPVIASLVADTKEFQAKMAEADASMQGFGRTSETTGAKFAAFGSKLATGILVGGAVIAAAAVKLAYNYNEALDQMQRSTNLTTAQMNTLKGTILNVSTQTATSATSIVSGYTQLIKAGYSLKASQTAVGAAAEFANAQHADLNTTLTAAINIEKLHIMGTRSVSNTLDIFTTAIKHSQLTADQLTQALSGRALSAFAAYHVDIKTATTLLAGFANQGMTGTKGLMALKSGFAALEKPVYSATGKISTIALALRNMGLNQATLASEARKPGGMLTVLQQINQAFNDNATATQKAAGLSAFMQQIFSTAAGPAFTNLITQLPHLHKLLDQLNHTGGANKNSFNEWLKSPAGAVDKFKTVLENSAIRLGDVILPKMTVGLIDVTKIVTHVLGSKIDMSLLQGGLGALIAGSLASKLVGGIAKVGESFGIAAAEGLALRATAIGTLIATGIALFDIGKPGQGKFNQTHQEWQKNKLGGAYDVGALTINTFTSALNRLASWIPGHHNIGQLPIVGTHHTSSHSGSADFSHFPKIHVKVTSTHRVRFGR